MFSLLDGASTPESLLAVATKLGLHALALTDFSDMGGVVRFAESAKGYSIIPIIGNQISVTLGGYQGRIVLLAQNARGYSNLSRLVTASRVNSPRGFPIIDAELLSEHTEGLFCLTGGPRGPLYQAMHVRDELGCSRMLGQIKDLFSNRCAVEVVHHGLRTEMEHALWAIKCAESGHLP